MKTNCCNGPCTKDCPAATAQAGNVATQHQEGGDPWDTMDTVICSLSLMGLGGLLAMAILHFGYWLLN
jgi:hypothetical protein